MKCVENFALSYTFPICMKSEFLSSIVYIILFDFQSPFLLINNIITRIGYRYVHNLILALKELYLILLKLYENTLIMKIIVVAWRL